MAAVETAPPVGAKTRDADAPVTYTLEQIKTIVAPKTRRYWIGIREDAPLEHTDAGGISVMKFSGPPPVDDDGQFNPKKIHGRGLIHALTDEQVAKFAERVANIIVRVETQVSDSVNPQTNERRSRETITRWMHLDSVKYDVRKDREGKPQELRTFTFQKNDVPLGYFLYCVPLREQMPIGWRDEKTPPRMCDTSSMVKAG